MKEEPLPPEKFLNDLGIKLETTTLVTVINGVMKQPDLCYLLNEYWIEKHLEWCKVRGIEETGDFSDE